MTRPCPAPRVHQAARQIGWRMMGADLSGWFGLGRRLYHWGSYRSDLR